MADLLAIFEPPLITGFCLSNKGSIVICRDKAESPLRYEYIRSYLT